VPNILTLPLFVLMAAWFAQDGLRRWRSVERGLHDLAARRWVVVASRLVRVAAVPASVGLWWLHGLVLVGGIVLLMLAYSLAGAPASLVRLTGGGDPNLARDRASEAAKATRLREIWDELNELAFEPAGLRMSRAARRRRLDALRTELEQLKSGATAEVAGLLAVQAQMWVFPPEEWTVREARREIELFQAAFSLWANGKRPGLDNEAQLRWHLFEAWRSLLEAMRASPEPDETAEREALARVRRFTEPRARAFVDVVSELVEADLDPTRTGEDAPELFARLHAAEAELWPDVWVFRGARLD
jgi:hypothetical protein